MKYEKIVAYFKEENGIATLIDEYKSLFDTIDDIGDQLMQGLITTISQYKEVLNQLTGAYISLEPLYSLSVAHKENEETAFYVRRKAELEAKGDKVVSAALEKESSLNVSEFRRIRNILEGYVLACEKGIVTCQTQMKRIEEDRNYKPTQQQ